MDRGASAPHLDAVSRWTIDRDVHLTCSLDPGLEETDTRPWILTNKHAFQAGLRHFVTCDILPQVKKNKNKSYKRQAPSFERATFCHRYLWEFII